MPDRSDATEKTVDNDTYGSVTAEWLSRALAVARRCSECGLLADVDPIFHEDRYGHAPQYTDGDGVTWRWETSSLMWWRWDRQNLTWQPGEDAQQPT